MTHQHLTAAGYHRATCYHRHRMTPHTLNWAHQPLPGKTYPAMNRVALDPGEKVPRVNYYELVRDAGIVDHGHTAPPDVGAISATFGLTHALTARSAHPGQAFCYRSVASAGALYPFELYLAAHRIDGMEPGVYHHDLFDSSFTALRPGPVPDIPPMDRGVAATFYISGIFFRSAWKYRSRAYRYVLLDAGHLLENLRLALRALKLSFSIHLDFDDEQTATLLGLDPLREVCLACVHLHGNHTMEQKRGDIHGLKRLSGEIRKASTVSEREVVYEEIHRIHTAGNLSGRNSAGTLPVLDLFRKQPESWIDLSPPAHPVPADYARVLQKRRSRRNFVSAAVSREGLMAFFKMVAHGMGSAPAMPLQCRSALAAGFLAGARMPVPSGLYLLDPQEKRLGQVGEGDFMEPMAAACLDQMWLKNAAVHLLFLTDLDALDRTFGPRGYRYAMIEAGRLGQQAYLAATALGWGGCGVGAIYDREAATLLGLSAGGALLYLVGAGPVKTR